MSIKIAGREVKTGDHLYHSRLGSFGRVLRVQSKNIELHVSTRQGAEVVFFVTEGGKINGEKLVYWHPPLVLDVPYRDISHLQALLDNAVESK